jgi:hypothetical protein
LQRGELITTIGEWEWRRSRKSGSGMRTWECQPDSEIPVDLLQQQMTTRAVVLAVTAAG